MRLDRRVPFFILAGVACLALIPLSDAGLRYVPIVTAIVYFALAVLFFFDWLGRRPPA